LDWVPATRIYLAAGVGAASEAVEYGLVPPGIHLEYGSHIMSAAAKRSAIQVARRVQEQTR
jgi:hypothetical protein